MSPRPYRLGQRQATVEQTRGRILSATRELLMENDGFTRFSIDLVARKADVARMTVYHQFGSKIGLLEALCDFLAANGNIEQLVSVFRLSDPFEGLERLVAIFGQFYETDRLVTRRLRALAALDAEFEQVIRARDERRRHALTVLMQRINLRRAFPRPETITETVTVLQALTSFESFDAMAGLEHSMEAAIPTISRLAHATVMLAYKEHEASSGK